MKASEEALALSRQAGDRRQEGVGLRRLAIVHLERLQEAEALPFAKAALALLPHRWATGPKNATP